MGTEMLRLRSLTPEKLGLEFGGDSERSTEGVFGATSLEEFVSVFAPTFGHGTDEPSSPTNVERRTDFLRG